MGKNKTNNECLYIKYSMTKIIIVRTGQIFSVQSVMEFSNRIVPKKNIFPIFVLF